MPVNESYPLVSIITPTYNRASFLEETINSILSQDYKNIEYIVIDDGSTDNTLEILDKYKNKLNYISQKNSGEVLAINKGLALVKGEMIGVVSSDDLLYPDAVSKIVQFFNDNENILVAYSDWDRIDERSRMIESFKTHDFDFINMVRWHENMLCVGAFFKRELIDKIKGRDPQYRYVADFDFWLRAGLAGNLKRIPLGLSAYRHHSDAASQKSKGHNIAHEHIKLIKNFYSNANLSNEIMKVKREAYSSAYYYAFASERKRNIFHMLFYLKASIFLYPRNFFNKDLSKIKSIPVYLFPEFLLNATKHFYRFIKKLKNCPKKEKG